ncbi:protein SDA1 homolog [Hydra vulgaris]|uniref:protein SDA1 homolog n=1 Tax=Hydra vulgaris TaxID=6087 RepID=UPI000641031A|nr:protein SDA1 homolog [Hydra vulgaris]
MSDRNRNNLPNNLAQLQNLIKRNPDLYKEEFIQQWRHFQSNLDVFKLNPSTPSESVAETAMFIAQVGNCYPEEIADLPMHLVDILSQHYSVMNSELRMTLCKALVLLRNKNMVPPLQVLQLFFKLLKAKDKLLRKTLYNHIVGDIKRVNAKNKNNKINTSLQNYMFSILKDNSVVAAKMSVDILIELYRKNIWNDAKTVNVLVTACHSKANKVKVAALKFFLGSDTPENVKDDSDSDSEDNETKAKKLIYAGTISKKTAKKSRKLEKALSLLRKSKKKKKPVSFNFSAIHLINDPQGFAETLFKSVEQSTDLFEVKLMVMNLIARLIGIHELIVLNFYPFLQRFLQPHQREVTKLLMFAAQSSHEMVPPDVIEPVLMTIANNFVSEKNNNEVMAVGLNAIREICARCPLSMSDNLLQDLVQYKTCKSKTVMMAARSLLQLYRNVDPTLLRKKDRGRPSKSTSTLNEHPAKEFGSLEPVSFVPGAEILELTKDSEVDHENNTDDDEWEEASEDEEDENEDEEDWIDVSHSEEEKDENEEVSDDEAIAADNEKKAEMVSTTRILTDEDFKKIQEQSLSEKLHGTKRKAQFNSDKSDIIDLAQIENVHKKMCHDKQSRLATVLAGREGRESYSKVKPKRLNEHASTTNKEKVKSKPFMMITHGRNARSKVKKSFREKQISLRDSLLKREGKLGNRRKR